MINLVKTGIFILGLLMYTTCSAQNGNRTPMTCGQLLAGLEHRVPDFQTDYGAILMGVAQTHPEACVPSGTLLGVMEAVFVHWGVAHPKLMGMEAWECAARAFAESYPKCNSRH